MAGIPYLAMHKHLTMKDFIYHAPTEVVFGKESEAEIAEMVRKCSHNYTVTQGRFKVLQPEDMTAIYRMAARQA